MIPSLILAAMLTAPIATGAPGKDNPLAVFICVERGHYEIGSLVNISIEVFKAGSFWDPGEMLLQIGQRPGGREIGFERQDTGRYCATIAVSEENMTGDSIELLCEVYTGFPYTERAEDLVFVPIDCRFDLTMRIPDRGDLHPVPGQTVEFLIETTYLGAAVAPDEGSLVVTLSWDSGMNDSTLACDVVETGVFNGTFTIPSGQNVSEDYQLWAEAEYTSSGRTLSGFSGARIELGFYNTWVHSTNISESGASLEVYSLTLDGAPLPGAQVSLEYTYMNVTSSFNTSTLVTTSDDEGRSAFCLTFAGIKDDWWVTCSGTVQHVGLAQEFYTSLTLGPLDSPSGEGFDVVSMNPLFLPYNTSLELGFVAYLNGTLLPDAVMVYYIACQSHYLLQGTVRTSEDGAFAISMLTPAFDYQAAAINLDELEAYFHTQVGGLWLSAECPMMMSESLSEVLAFNDPLTSISVGDFCLGGTAECIVDDSRADGTDEIAYVLCGVGRPSDVYSLASPEWVFCGRGGVYHGPVWPVDCEWTGEAWRAMADIPTMFGNDTPFYFLGVLHLDATEWSSLHVAWVLDRVAVPINYSRAVTIDVPGEGENLNASCTFQGTAQDPSGVVRVEVSIDGGSWVPADGEASWSYQLDTRLLEHGAHRLDVRLFNGRDHSRLTSVNFTVDQVPTVTSSFKDHQRVNGTIDVRGMSSDDLSVERTEYRVDSGDWSSMAGGDEWNCSIDTTVLASGDHTIGLRCFDGVAYSEMISITIVVDQRPTVSLESDVDGRRFSGDIPLAGTAADDGTLVAIEVRVDGGGWAVAGDESPWTYMLVTGDLKAGEHRLELRADDGNQYSDVATANFILRDHGAEGVFSTVTWVVVVVVIFVSCFACGYAYDRRRRA